MNDIRTFKSMLRLTNIHGCIMKCAYETSVSDLYTHTSQWESILSSVLIKLVEWPCEMDSFSIWNSIVYCLWCVHNRSLEERYRNVLPFVFLNSYLFFEWIYTALLNVQTQFSLVDVLIFIYYYLRLFVTLRPPLPDSKALSFFLLFNERHTHTHMYFKCVMNTRRNLHILRIKHNIQPWI
jgi:hypothetical protein